MEEAELIRKAMQKDTGAWETLVGSHQEAVYRLGYLILGDADEAEDVAQEAMIRAYYALDRFDIARPLRPWLLRIVANRARNRQRSAGRYLNALRQLVRGENSTGKDIEDRAAENMESQALWQAVRRLAPADQQVVYLRYFLNLSVDESAEVMGVASGTVKSRLHRALGRLRAVIEREFPEIEPVKM